MSKSTRDGDKQAFWQLAVDEQARSGLSVRAFCRREGLGEASFYAWRRKLTERAEPSDAPEQAAFVEVTAARGEPQRFAAVADVSVRVLLPCGAIVCVQAGFDTVLLRQVVEALS